MATTVHFQTQLTYQQVAQLVRQLPAKDKQKLARLLEAETTPQNQTALPGETDLTPAQRNTVANVRQGFKELKLLKEGKLKARPLSDLLNEL